MIILVLLLMNCTQQHTNEEQNNTDQPQQCENTFPPTQVEYEDHEDHSSGEMPEELIIPIREDFLPTYLSETPLYTNISTKEVHPSMYYYEPQYQLWSDGAVKKRWTYIPECEQIDSSDNNDWQFPVGTRFFKEFSIDGKRVETRLIERIGTGPRDFAYASYLWNDDETEATKVTIDGLSNVSQTNHDVPSKQECLQCHGSYAYGGGRPSRGLGFSAIQLSHDGNGTTLADLLVEDKLSTPLEIENIAFPGTQTEQDALGYLHANCGNCHNDSKDGIPHTDLNLWVNIGFATPQDTPTWKTAVNIPSQLFKTQHVDSRIEPGSPQHSSLYYRMSKRGNNAQMPPIASKRPDEEGLQIIHQWIEELQ